MSYRRRTIARIGAALAVEPEGPSASDLTFTAAAQERLDRLADFEGSEGWLFPAGNRTF
jgi:hypothetical protein